MLLLTNLPLDSATVKDHPTQIIDKACLSNNYSIFYDVRGKFSTRFSAKSDKLFLFYSQTGKNFTWRHLAEQISNKRNY